jgi:hypothetical protein
VTVVSDNPETLDGLQAYFQQAGVGAHGTRRFDDLTIVPPGSTAIVFFPDDFEAGAVIEAVLRLRRMRPQALSILVTADPRRFGAVANRDSGAPEPVVLPKPAWGWTILDTIRNHMDAASSAEPSVPRTRPR